MSLEAVTQRELLGSGRSGLVFLSVDDNGRHIAEKVFSGSTATKLVHYVFSGAPNPYSWSEDAVLCAHYRRQILNGLVGYWFGNKLRIADSYGIEWDEEFKAYKLRTEFIDGRHAALHNPFSDDKDYELSDLVNNVMRPLQRRLAESGFDGLVWQAGKGNPVAANNFLLEETEDRSRWVWIDLESGVPALFPMNPVSLFTFYLPKSLKHRHALFDDVDTGKLREYLMNNGGGLVEHLGFDGYVFLHDTLTKLMHHQERWKDMRRAHRSITSQLKKGRLTEEQAEWYYKHPFIWYEREFARGLLKGYNKVAGEIPYEAFERLCSIDYMQLVSNAIRFAFSGRYRSELARNFVRRRIESWEERRNLDSAAANYLNKQLETETTSRYLIDFIVHAGMKPLEMTAIPATAMALYANGIIDENWSAALMLAGGSITRTLYTLGRITVSGAKPNRYIALAVGLIPTLGNAAYPLQMVYSEATVDREVGKFLLYDIFSEIGQRFPVWGSKDTLTEHFFNHIPDVVVGNRQKVVYHNQQHL